MRKEIRGQRQVGYICDVMLIIDVVPFAADGKVTKVRKWHDWVDLSSFDVCLYGEVDERTLSRVSERSEGARGENYTRKFKWTTSTSCADGRLEIVIMRTGLGKKGVR